MADGVHHPQCRRADLADRLGVEMMPAKGAKMFIIHAIVLGISVPILAYAVAAGVYLWAESR